MASLTTAKVSARRVSVKVKDAYWVMVAVDKDKPAIPPCRARGAVLQPSGGPEPPRSGAALWRATVKGKIRSCSFATVKAEAPVITWAA